MNAGNKQPEAQEMLNQIGTSTDVSPTQRTFLMSF